MSTADTPRTVAYYTDSSGFGGAEQALLTLLDTIDRCHWRPLLLLPKEATVGILAAEARRLGVPVVGVPSGHGLAALASTLHLGRKLRHLKAGLLHAHLNSPLACRYGLLAAYLAGVPSIATEQLPARLVWGRPLILQYLIGLTVGRYVAVSEELSLLLQRRLRVPPRKIRVIHNSTPLASQSATENEHQSSDSATFTVLTVARLHVQKGHRYLLEAAAQIPEARFVFAGDGPEALALQAYARKLGIESRVDFLGHRSDIPDLLRRCDVFVLPSLFEGLPISILEAMALRKPVIATAVGGTPEIIQDGRTGILVPPHDSAQLGSAIRTLFADTKLRTRLAVAGRKRVQAEFSARAMVERTVSVYDELLQPKDSAQDGRTPSIRGQL